MIAVVILTWMVSGCAKSRATSKQLEQAVDKAHCSAESPRLGAGDDGLFRRRRVKGLESVFFLLAAFSRMSASGRRWVQCSVWLQLSCWASCSTGAVFASILVHFSNGPACLFCWSPLAWRRGDPRLPRGGPVEPLSGNRLRSEQRCCRRIRCLARCWKGSLAIRKRRASAKWLSGLFISSRRWWHLPCRRGIIPLPRGLRPQTLAYSYNIL